MYVAPNDRLAKIAREKRAAIHAAAVATVERNNRIAMANMAKAAKVSK